MNNKLWFLIVLWMRLFSDIYTQVCPPEKVGNCNTSNGQHDNDTDVTEVRPLCSLNCDFESDLCDYRQGCKDDGMTAWQAVNGSAQSDQESANVCGRQSFSMLESGWVNFSTATNTCFQFTVTRRLPYALDVYLKSYDDRNDIRVVMNRSLAGNSEGRFTYNYTLSHNLTVAKVLFRLYGGGGYAGAGDRRLLQLHSVSMVEGSCGTDDCYGNYRVPPCPGWVLVNWVNHIWAGDERYAYVAFIPSSNNDHLPATLTVPLSRPPLPGKNAHCLTFRYKIRGLNAALNVSVRLLNGLTMTVWSLVGKDGGNPASWLNATVPVNVTSAYFIIFEGRLNLTSDEVSLTSVIIRGNIPCQLFPPEADTGHPVPSGWWSTSSACSPAMTTTTERPTTDDHSQPTTNISATTIGQSSPSPLSSLSPSSSPPTTANASLPAGQPSTPASSSQSPAKEGHPGRNNDSDERAIIAGVTVAVVVVLAVTVSAVVWKWYSKRKQQYSVHKEDMNGTTMHDVCKPVQY